jgi:hypothetical protein
MADTRGTVNRLTVIHDGSPLACVWIGVSPTNSEILYLVPGTNRPPYWHAWENSLLNGLAAAAESGCQAAVVHLDNDAEILGLRLTPS